MSLAGGVNGCDVSLVVDGDLEGVTFFALGKADEENGFAGSVEGDVLDTGFFAERGLTDGGECGFELLWSRGEDGGPLAIELGGALVDEGGPFCSVGVATWLKEKAVLVLIGWTVACGVV